MKYTIPDARSEAALVLRCPNARKSRESGYAVGLCAPNGWIYNVNRVYHYEHGTAGAKKLLDITGEPNAATVSIGDATYCGSYRPRVGNLYLFRRSLSTHGQ